MVVFVADIVGVLAAELEGHTPIAAHFYGPRPLSRPLKLVEPQPWQLHVSSCRRGVESAENQSESVFMLGLDAALTPGGEELFKALVSKSLDRH